MPTYEYACPTCGIVEAFQSIKEPALTKCPSCKKAKVQRMVSSGAGVIFKGSGFWETDYNRGGDYAKKQKADVAPAAAKNDSKSGGKDSKPTDKPITTSPAGGAGAAAGDVAPKAKAQAKPQLMAKAGGAS
jgi:putative FmdB family regulatory protein